MNYPVIKHQDSRRTLVEWVKDYPIKCIKTIYVKEKADLGNHYHLKKDEIFYMAQGKALVILKNGKKYSRQWMFEGDCILASKGTIHTFTCYPNTILLEAATEPYDPVDEIRA